MGGPSDVEDDLKIGDVKSGPVRKALSVDTINVPEPTEFRDGVWVGTLYLDASIQREKPIINHLAEFTRRGIRARIAAPTDC